jgi:hypothetical protein
MKEDPIALWEAIYPLEEVIAGEDRTLASIYEQLGSGDAIAPQVQAIQRVLAQIEQPLAEAYLPWASDAKSYHFASEAFYQFRLLSLLHQLSATAFKFGPEAGVICTRQIVKPSAFNGTPRIKRFPGIAFIIFPAAMVAWMYVIFEMIAASLADNPVDPARIDEYLRHLIAGRTFERWANPATAYAIDFVLETLVFCRRPPSESPWRPQATPLSLNLVAAVEDFILCHELAHLSLGHGETAGLEIEAAADRRALEMLHNIDGRLLLRAPLAEIGSDEIYLLGYVSLRLWTIVRLAAEMRVLPYVCESPEEVEAHRIAITRRCDERAAQAQSVGLRLGIGADHFIRALFKANGRVVDAINEFSIDREEANEIRKLAKSLATDEYGLISQRMFSEARKRQRAT